MKNLNKTIVMAFLAITAGRAMAHSEITHTGNLLVTAKLDGVQSIPAVNTTASGIASVFINAGMDTAKIQVTVAGLSGGITGIHIHEGKKGASGGVVTDLSTALLGNSAQLLVTGNALTKTWISKLLSGQYYVNVHTAANPNGEIRGQLTLETDWSFTAWVNGAQQVPTHSTSAYGMVVFNLNKDNSSIEYKGVFDGLSGAVTGIHLHSGAKGATGGVVLDLASNYSNGVLMGQADPSSFLADLMAGNIYINVHTAANPGGEIRGQLAVDNYLAFDAWMDGPSAGTNATEVALASVKISTGMDTIWYNIASNLNLMDTINGLHFHHSTGIIDLDAGLNGNMAMGMITGSELTPKILKEFMAGTIYLAFHSKAYPAVKLKGDVTSLKREGYILNISGLNQNPMVITTGTGNGIVSINRDHSSAHIMAAYANLTGPATGIHFHVGTKGNSGAVLKDLMPFHTALGNGGIVALYWNSKSTVAFSMADALKFDKDSVYINIHTALNPNGEARGQAERSFMYQAQTAGTHSPKAGSFTLYPNPAQDFIQLRYNEQTHGYRGATIYNVAGHAVLQSQDSKIDIRNLPAGTYFIRTDSDQGQLSLPFIKQ